MNKLRSLVIDDEPNARMRLRRLLKDDERIEIIGQAKDGLEAVTEIQRLLPGPNRNSLFLHGPRNRASPHHRRQRMGQLSIR